MSENLYEKLINYSASDIYPFCMPGHKRHAELGTFLDGPVSIDPYRLDITEVEGFDDLHRPHGILKDITDDIARLYGELGGGVVKPAAFMSVNGSTACNLAAVNTMPKEGALLAAANCHPSVFNGAEITGKKVIQFEPDFIEELGTYGGADPQAVKTALEENPDINTVVITSPSYEGFVSDVREIAGIVHENDAILVVDEAHGAHLPFCEGFPRSALYLGADIVIHSLHKTLGSLNQTAVAFVANEKLADAFAKKLLMFMTTSPSYMLMASIQAAAEWAGNNKEAFTEYCQRLAELRAELGRHAEGLGERGLHLIDKTIVGKYNIYDLDPTRLVFHAEGLGGKELYRKFYEEHRLQLERCGDGFALALSSVWDSTEGFERLKAAVQAIDRELKEKA